MDVSITHRTRKESKAEITSPYRSKSRGPMDAAPKGPPISSVKPKAKTTVRLGDQPCSSRCSTAAREPIKEFLVSLAPRPQTISPSKTGKTQTVESQQDCLLEI